MSKKEVQCDEVIFFAFRPDEEVRNCFDSIRLKYVGEGLSYTEAIKKNHEIINNALSQFPEYEEYMTDRWSTKEGILDDFYYDVKDREKLKEVVNSMQLYRKHTLKLSQDAIEKLYQEISVKAREKEQQGWKIHIDIQLFLEATEFPLWFQEDMCEESEAGAMNLV